MFARACGRCGSLVGLGVTLSGRCARAGLHSIVRLGGHGRSGSTPVRPIRRPARPTRPAGTAPKPWPRLGRATGLEVVGALVHVVPGVAFDPFEGDAASFHSAVDLLDQLQVLDGFLVGLRPAALFPAESPLGHDVDRVLRVGEDVQFFAGLGRGLKQAQDGGQLPQVVGALWPAARVPRVLVHVPGPPRGSGIAEGRTVCRRRNRHALILSASHVPDRKRDEAGVTPRGRCGGCGWMGCHSRACSVRRSACQMWQIVEMQP